MNPVALRTALGLAWLAFWVGWLLLARWSKQGRSAGARIPAALPLIVVVVILAHAFKGRSLAVDALAVQIVGIALFAGGLGIAIWARFVLGRNWGMPMTLKDEPELVTSGPYRRVRHPIYTGILLALLGTALATYLYWLIALAGMAAYFVYCARVEERLMGAAFPSAYPGYRARTKMLIPFVL